MQAMGFTPAKKAEYAEARSTQQLLRSGLGHAATDIRNRLISALQSNDMAAARDVYAEAIKFDRANPRYAVLPGLVGSVRSRQREAATARQLNAPLGTKPEYANRTDWANFGD